MSDTEAPHKGLPVSGYRAQSSESVALVNMFKAKEEALLRDLDAAKNDPNIDQRWLAIGRTALEQAFMAINRSVFKPGRVVLVDDPDPQGRPADDTGGSSPPPPPPPPPGG